ncbi:hypothetical protein TNCV_513251 [Trichonephila clavipes]|nr:hypothetical protein TNCV_513251 [Trichonephila clavipes]
MGRQRFLSFLVALLLCPEEEFPGKQSSAILQRLAFTLGIQSGMTIWLHPAGKTGYCGVESIRGGRHLNKCVFFSVMSQNVPDKVIFDEFSF